MNSAALPGHVGENEASSHENDKSNLPSDVYFRTWFSGRRRNFLRLFGLYHASSGAPLFRSGNYGDAIH